MRGGDLVDCYKEERLKLLEERNERLFRAIGQLDFEIKYNPHGVMPLTEVRKLLETIVGKESESYVLEA